ncbi:MAG: ABC transporter substrate-binding protein [Chloroflexi bacterium]|nr:ABC transporter substrate-binding protein [Chloroflexota bacterium]
MSREIGELLDELIRRRISRRHFISRAAALGLSVGAIGAIISACGGGGTATPAATGTGAATGTPTAAGSATAAAVTGGKPAADQTLVVGVQEVPATFDPAVNWDYGGVVIEPHVYEGLMRSWRGTTESILEPDLAASYQISDDGLTYTFKLNDGIRFSDGNPLTSADVKYTFDRVKTMNQGPAALFVAMDTVEAPDPLTVVIKLKNRFAPFLGAVGSPWGAGIVNSKLVQANEKDGDMGQAWLRDHGAGSGPFLLDTWDKERNQVVMSRNKTWWRGWDEKPHLDKVIARWITEQAQQRLLLESGELDMAVGLTPEDFDAIKQEQGIVGEEFLGSRMQRLWCNCAKKPFDNVKVRQAMNYAFNCDTVISGVLNGHAAKMEGVFQKGLAGWAPATTQYNFDLDKAKSLLAEAGLADGFDAGEMVWLTGFDWARASLEVYQGDLAKIGVKAQIREIPYPTYFEVINDPATTPEILLGGGLGPDYADGFEMLYVAYGSDNVPFDNANRFKNDQVDSLLKTAMEELDDTKRYALYKQIIDLVAEQAASSWCIQLNDLIGRREIVQGYEYSFLFTKHFFPFPQMWKAEA